jgi:hypothetical protein
MAKTQARQFSQVELSFFERYWKESKEEQKETLRDLVKNEQLSFLNGGYVMNDEACTLWEDTIDQMTLGHQILLSIFSYVPKIACMRFFPSILKRQKKGASTSLDTRLLTLAFCRRWVLKFG